MADVLEFQPKKTEVEPAVWTCRCGSQLFYLRANLDVECVTCGLVPPTWRLARNDNGGNSDGEEGA